MNPLYSTVAERAEGRCEYCRAPELVFNFAFEVEHIFPRALGGDDSLENLALACESCNLHKSTAIAGWDEVEGVEVSLFNPRRDMWERHYFFDEDTGLIVGRTAIGRVTITRLKMNSPFQLRARRHWMQLGLYP